MNEIRVHGKCILAGEHGVVRGGEAVVFPLSSCGLNLQFRESPRFSVKEGPLRAPFLEAWRLAALRAEFSLEPAVEVELTSDIPVRAGLGSSAALAVATVRLLEALGARIENSFEHALEIENIFHGKSSGLDVAAVLSAEPIAYRRGQAPEKLKLAWEPKLYLLDTGLRSATKTCVEKVEAAHRPDLDEQMQASARAAKKALLSANGEAGLAQAMESAAECFQAWGLSADPKLVGKLKRAGALAVKPTGSGGGGHLLSLWSEIPPAELGLRPVRADSSVKP